MAFPLFVLASCSHWTHYILYMLCYCGLSCQKKLLSSLSSPLAESCYCLPVSLQAEYFCLHISMGTLDSQAKLPNLPSSRLCSYSWASPSCSQGCCVTTALWPAGRPARQQAGKPVFWPWCLTCFPHTVAEYSAALSMLLWKTKGGGWVVARRRPLKAKCSLSIRKPAGVAWQHTLLYNSRKLATVVGNAVHAIPSNKHWAQHCVWYSLLYRQIITFVSQFFF